MTPTASGDVNPTPKTEGREVYTPPACVWDGPRTSIERFPRANWMIHIGWWLEPEAEFVPITSELRITGSASPVYVESGPDA